MQKQSYLPDWSVFNTMTCFNPVFVTEITIPMQKRLFSSNNVYFSLYGQKQHILHWTPYSCKNSHICWITAFLTKWFVLRSFGSKLRLQCRNVFSSHRVYLPLTYEAQLHILHWEHYSCKNTLLCRIKAFLTKCLGSEKGFGSKALL